MPQPENARFQAKNLLPLPAAGFQETPSGEGGIRTSLENPEKTTIFVKGGAESGAVAFREPDLALIVEAWSRLSEAIKAGILAMVRAADS